MSELGQKVIEGVRITVADRPDFVYDASNGCNYIKDGSPSCLVGQGLWSAGLIDATFRGDYLDEATDIEMVVNEYEWSFDPDEVLWLTRVQRCQDQGFTWSEAVARADGADDE